MRRPPNPPGPSSSAAARAILLGDGIDPEFFTRCAERFPRLAYVRLGRERLYLLSHPDLVRFALVESGRDTTKARGLQGARRILGNGLLTSEDPYHQQVRRLVQPAFHAEQVARYAAVMQAATRRLDRQWRAGRWRDGARVDLAGQMSRLTFDIVGEALFGARPDASAAEVRAALDELLSAYNRAFLPWFELSLRLGTPLGRRVQAAAGRLDVLVRAVIARGGPGLPALLPQELSEQQVRDEAMTLLLAGHETTSAALTFAWYLLDRHPEVRAWLEQEVDAAVEPEPGELEVAALPRTRAVIAEALRLYPPAWVLGRRFTAPVDIDGRPVPAGATALVSQWVLHRDGRFWSQPRRFVPQRWLDRDGRFDESAPGQPRYAYFPFGAGRRMCLGESFARTEAVLVLAWLVRRWRVRVDPAYRLRLRAAITLRPAGALPVTLHHR